MTQQKFTDFYNILNLDFGATETEIKKQYRKLAIMYHPDKNGGSKKSEETFKLIANAYETLTNKQKRTVYDLEYKEKYQKPKHKVVNPDEKQIKKDQSNSSTYKKKDFHEKEKSYSTMYIAFVFILIFTALIYLLSDNNKKNATGNKAEQKLEEIKQERRPQTGELEF
jgi:curved DNA-binding protein CbpA